jgi:hypothetical protein
MRRAQGPGDARGGQARLRSRHVYTMRRLLAAMILLLLLVLIVPRACQRSSLPSGRRRARRNS